MTDGVNSQLRLAARISGGVGGSVLLVAVATNIQAELGFDPWWPALRSSWVVLGALGALAFFWAYRQGQLKAVGASGGTGTVLFGIVALPFHAPLAPLPPATSADFWKGAAALQLERAMTVEQTYPAIIVVTRAGAFDLLALGKEMGSSGSIDIRAVQVSDVMVARLFGEPRSGFSIVPDRAESKAIGQNGEIRWSWDVTPKTEGKQKLVFELDAIVKSSAGTEAPSNVYRQFIPIEVEVVPWYRSAINWLWRILTGEWLWSEIGKGILAVVGPILLAWAVIRWKRIAAWWRRHFARP
jgi:hypothetical protein